MPPPGGEVVGPELLVIGRREYVEFPEWGPLRVRAKVDTGAYSSALDVDGFELIETGGQIRARLHLVLNRRKARGVRVVETPVVGMVVVACSSGASERRPLIEPLVRLGPIERRIRLTVTNRAPMRYRMLLGRQALAGHFLVDVGGAYLLPR
jgi:hypothetical protein